MIIKNMKKLVYFVGPKMKPYLSLVNYSEALALKEKK